MAPSWLSAGPNRDSYIWDKLWVALLMSAGVPTRVGTERI